MQPLNNYPAPEPVGLLDAIQAAGHAAWTVDGVRYATDAAAVQAIIDTYSLDQAKAEVRSRIDLHAKEVFDRAVAGYSPGEIAGWPILRAEAKLYAVTGNEADCPAISMEAAQRGIDVPSLVAKVQVNTAKFDALRAAIAGVSGRHRDAVASLSTFEAVAEYDYSTGWPL